MCGIGGYSSRSVTSVSRQHISLEKASQLLAHRGPDDHGIFEDQLSNVGLVHRRLSIIDVSDSGHQPMSDCEERVFIVYNGEIYNFKGIRDELQSKGYIFFGKSDTEVLLRYYVHCKTQNIPINEFLGTLNGIFAFAIWDMNAQQLIVAKDAFGVKPLYFYCEKGHFAFASEIKALLHLIPDSPLGIDAVALSNYLSFLWCPGEGTPVREIRKVAPGQALIVHDGGIVDTINWYREPVLVKKEGRAVSMKTARCRVQNLLRKAVHRQMVSDVPVGAFLSGGLDSSSIVAFAREHSPDIECYTIEVEGQGKDGFQSDLPYAKKVADYLQVKLNSVKLGIDQVIEGIQEMVWQLDEPLADLSGLHVYSMSRLAQKNGIKVLLSGLGGDDLFSGYRRHHAIQIDKYKSWIPRAGWAYLERLSKSINQNHPLFRRTRKFLNGISYSGDERLVNYFRWASPEELKGLFSNDMQSALRHSQHSIGPMQEFLSTLALDSINLDRMLALEKRFFLADHNLIYTDKMSMAAGVEVRVPFLDPDLVEFAAQLPEKMKYRGGNAKWILKKAMEPLLPRDVVYRPKTGFGVPLRYWIQGPLNSFMADVFHSSSFRDRGIFDVAAVQRMVDSNFAGKIDASYTLLSVLCIELWFRKFGENREFNFCV